MTEAERSARFVVAAAELRQLIRAPLQSTRGMTVGGFLAATAPALEQIRTKGDALFSAGIPTAPQAQQLQAVWTSARSALDALVTALRAEDPQRPLESALAALRGRLTEEEKTLERFASLLDDVSGASPGGVAQTALDQEAASPEVAAALQRIEPVIQSVRTRAGR